MVGVCLALGLLGHAVPVAGQGAGVTAVTFRQYLAGATTPIAPPFVIQVVQVTCNLSAPAILLHQISWDDPDNAGRVCLFTDPGTGPLFAKVFGAIEGTLTNVAGTAESPESARAPFLRPPAAPTGVKVAK